MDLIPTLSTFNNKVGTTLKGWGLSQANAPIVNPFYTTLPAWIISLALPGILTILVTIFLIGLYIVLFRHELVRKQNDEDEEILGLVGEKLGWEDDYRREEPPAFLRPVQKEDDDGK